MGKEFRIKAVEVESQLKRSRGSIFGQVQGANMILAPAVNVHRVLASQKDGKI